MLTVECQSNYKVYCVCRVTGTYPALGMQQADHEIYRITNCIA
jgi:hypothetical protein